MLKSLRWLNGRSKTRSPSRPEAAEGPDEDMTDEEPEDENSKDETLWFPAWPPLNPREILADRKAYLQRLGYRKYRAPEYVFEDSPLFGLYRLYEWIMADHVINMRNELEVFWYVLLLSMSIISNADTD
jgi:hypothetical protein